MADNAIISTPTLDSSAAFPSGESFLQVYVTADLPVLISVQHLTEILTIPTSQIAPMFQMPPWVMGVHNWRGDVLWMVDLNHFLGLTPWYQQAEYAQKHTAVVLKSPPEEGSTIEEDAVLGLVVHHVDDMVFCEPDSICSTSDPLERASEIKPFLQGYWQQSSDERYPILDSVAIIRAMPKIDGFTSS